MQTQGARCCQSGTAPVAVSAGAGPQEEATWSSAAERGHLRRAAVRRRLQGGGHQWRGLAAAPGAGRSAGFP
jgi:hypothetical protein